MAQDLTSGIQAELHRLSKAKTIFQGPGACLFNLIVYTHELRRTAYFNDMVKKVRAQFPCRVIFIQGNSFAKQNHFRVEVKKERDQEQSGFICDQISIEAAGQDLNRVYFLLLPLFVPDLPIYLLWGQDPTTEDTILPHLEQFATRLILDAETTDDLQQFTRDMLNRISSCSIQTVDMNWARIAGWREVLAQIFDSPERVEQLATATHIKIVYNDRRSELLFHHSVQAIYLQGWLASRLGWTFQRAEKENDSQLLYYSTPQTHCRIQLISGIDEHIACEEILAIEVTGDKGYQCDLQRKSVDQVKVQASNQIQCELPCVLLMPTLRSTRSFMQEIFYQKMSDHYEPMLKFISVVKWTSG